YSPHKKNKKRGDKKSFQNDLAFFITGTNPPVLSKNKISVWGLESRSSSDEVEELASVPIDGIITDLKVFENNNKPMIVASTSKGSLHLFSIYNLPSKFEYLGYQQQINNRSLVSRNSDDSTYDICNIFKEKSCDPINKNSSLNSIDISYDQQHLITVGNDGFMSLLSLDSLLPIYTNRYIDGLGVNVVKSISNSQVITSGENPIIKFWDFRANSTTPTKIIKTQSPRINSLEVHQDQQHIIAAGGSDGRVTLFDIRSGDYPIDQNKNHNSDVWELSFNKSNPNQLYSCSEDGSIYQYSYSNDNFMRADDDNTFDLYNKEVTPLQLPGCIGSIDSFDINSNINRLICCSTTSQCLIVKSI
ncbi:hypothetical protein DICPUDRAFT_35300, partial [Dictyostelium purpureum]